MWPTDNVHQRRETVGSSQANQVRSAIRAVAAGRDWMSARLAYIFATMTPPTCRLSASRNDDVSIHGGV